MPVSHWVEHVDAKAGVGPHGSNGLGGETLKLSTSSCLFQYRGADNTSVCVRVTMQICADMRGE